MLNDVMGEEEKLDMNSLEVTTEEIIEHFLKALSVSEHKTYPYDYWLLSNALPKKAIKDIINLAYKVPDHMDFSQGRRETNNKIRNYFSKQNQELFPIFKAMSDTFKDKRIISAFKTATGKNLNDGLLRLEYCQDTDGFWLEPHKDISVKLFTMSIYLDDDPALRGCGTDIYDDTPERNHVATAPYGEGEGMIFIPSHNSWHGFEKRTIPGVRKSLILNYVTSDWLAVEELC